VDTGFQDTVSIVKTSLALGAQGKRETHQVFHLVDLEPPFEDRIVQLPPHFAGKHYLFGYVFWATISVAQGIIGNKNWRL
jgi:hypothetical protein